MILESLALYYRWVLERIEAITDNTIEVLHIVGGGSKNKLLSQFTTNAINRKVIAGPVEATASGNVLMQAIATGQIESVQQARKVVRRSFELEQYTPTDAAEWNKAYQQHAPIFEE